MIQEFVSRSNVYRRRLIRRLCLLTLLSFVALLFGCGPPHGTIATSTSTPVEKMDIQEPTSASEPGRPQVLSRTRHTPTPTRQSGQINSRSPVSVPRGLTPTFTSTATSIPPPTNTPDADIDEVLTDEPDPRSGGWLGYLSGNYFVPDPVFAGVGDSNLILREIYSGLVKPSYDPNIPFDLELAERFTVQNDGRTYEFKLKNGLQFSDGTPVVASDFKWTWERALRVASESATDQVSLVLGSINGAEEVLKGKTDELAGVTIVDDRTLTVNLDGKRGDFLSLLANPIASVLKPSNVSSWGVDWTLHETKHEDPDGTLFEMKVLPVGTGPFRLAEFDLYKDRYKIERNEHYHDRTAYLDGVVFVTDIFVEGVGMGPGFMRKLADDAFLDGSIDINRLRHSDPEMSDTDSTHGPSDLLRVETPAFTSFIAFNSSLPPYDDVHFRRALVAAVDLRPVLAVHGFSEATAISPPDERNKHDRQSAIPHDVEAALTELSLSKYFGNLDGLHLTFHYGALGGFSDEINLIVDSWKDSLNVSAEFRYVIPPRYNELVEVNGLEMMLLFFHPDYPDPQATFGVFETIFGDRAESPELAELRTKLADASEETDFPLRAQKYADLEQHILDDALAMPLWWRTSNYYVRVQRWVHGYRVPKYGGSRFKDVWLDETASERSPP